MKTDYPIQIPPKLAREIADAVVRGQAPESAMTRPAVEVVQTTVLRGGGESTSWHGYVLIRVNGKQVWRGTVGMFETSRPLALIGRLAAISKTGRRSLFSLSAV